MVNTNSQIEMIETSFFDSSKYSQWNADEWLFIFRNRGFVIRIVTDCSLFNCEFKVLLSFVLRMSFKWIYFQMNGMKIDKTITFTLYILSTFTLSIELTVWMMIRIFGMDVTIYLSKVCYLFNEKRFCISDGFSFSNQFNFIEREKKIRNKNR